MEDQIAKVQFNQLWHYQSMIDVYRGEYKHTDKNRKVEQEQSSS